MNSGYVDGVKPRFDGKGSEFGDIHRLLPAECGMFDIDRMKGNITLDIELRKKDTGFIEYRTDFKNLTVNFVALFEIKYKWSEYVIRAMECKIGTATFAQREMCKKLEFYYFIVVADSGRQPFEFFKLDDTGYETYGCLEYGDDIEERRSAVREFWGILGLL